MGTTILRVEKVKSMANIRQSGAHIHRHHANTPNADPALKHRNTQAMGSNNLARDVQSRLDTLSKPPRRNAVLAVDGILSLSPDLLGDEESVKKWGNAALGWLKEEFGENLVSVVLHRDESTPHIHFTVVPVDEKPDGRRVLNARDMFDKWKLAAMQRSYNAAIQRRIENVQEPNYGSKAKHTTIAQFYEILNNNQDALISEFVAGIRGKLEGAMEAKFESLLSGLDAHVKERMDQTHGDMQEQLKTFYKELRAEAVKLKGSDRDLANESAQGAFELVDEEGFAEVMRAAVDQLVSSKTEGRAKKRNSALKQNI